MTIDYPGLVFDHWEPWPFPTRMPIDVYVKIFMRSGESRIGYPHEFDWHVGMLPTDIAWFKFVRTLENDSQDVPPDYTPYVNAEGEQCWKPPFTKGPVSSDWKRLGMFVPKANIVVDVMLRNGEIISGQVSDMNWADSAIEFWRPHTESDPNGLPLNAPGAKADAGKLRPWLVLGAFANALTEVTKIGTYGAEKYSPNGWLEVKDGHERYQEAFMRHLLAIQRGETIDPAWRLSHMAHLCWNALAILELEIRNE